MYPLRPFLPCLLLAALGLPSTTSANSADSNKKEQERAAQDLAQNIVLLKLKKVYVPDFLDSSGTRTDRSALSGAGFSKTLSEHARKFEVVDRRLVQKSYDRLRVTAGDLQKPEILVNLGLENGADAILLGKVSQTAKQLVIDLSLRDARSGEDLYHSQYRMEKTPAMDEFAAFSDSSGRVFYFSGFDGVGVPKCVSCPQPTYTDRARSRKIQGTVLLSAVFTAQGTVEQILLIKSLEPTLDKASVDIMRRWKILPAKDGDGNPVPVRVPVETTFRMY